MYLNVKFENQQKLFQLEDNKEYVIGRSSKSEIHIPVEGISRAHAKIIVRNGDFFIVDLGSTNGVTMNEEKIEPSTEVPFNTFFPATLSYSVELQLLDDIDQNDPSVILSKFNEQLDQDSAGEDQTVAMKFDRSKLKASSSKSVSLAGDNQSKENELARDLSRERKIRRKIQETHTQKSTIVKYWPLLFLSLMIVSFFVYHYFESIQSASVTSFDETKTPSIEEMRKRLKAKNQVQSPKKENTISSNLAPQKGATQKEKVQYLQSKIMTGKCLLDIEKSFCQSLVLEDPLTYIEGFGKELEKLYLVLNVRRERPRFMSILERMKTDEKSEQISLSKEQFCWHMTVHSFLFRTNSLKLDNIENLTFILFTDDRNPKLYSSLSLGNVLIEKLHTLKKAKYSQLQTLNGLNSFKEEVEKLDQAFVEINSFCR